MNSTGQIGFDLKRDYIKESRKSKAENPQNELPPSFEGDPDDIESLITPEDTYKNIRGKLRLDQSSMTPKETPKTKTPAPKETAAVRTPAQKMEDIANKSDTVLLKVSTVWPFTIFKNDIIIDPYKVNIVYREFFWSEHIHSIMVRDILDVIVETSVFFATLKIVDQGYTANTVDIEYLKRDEALKVRKIIQGLIIAHRQALDLSGINSSNIKDHVDQMGKIKGIDKELIPN
jgi:hypothetical protein